MKCRASRILLLPCFSSISTSFSTSRVPILESLAFFFRHVTPLREEYASWFIVGIGDAVCIPYPSKVSNCTYGRVNRKMDIPLGTCHIPPLPRLNSLPDTSATTRPLKTQKTMWFRRECLVFFSPPGGRSTMPEWKNGRVMVLAY